MTNTKNYEGYDFGHLVEQYSDWMYLPFYNTSWSLENFKAYCFDSENGTYKLTGKCTFNIWRDKIMHSLLCQDFDLYLDYLLTTFGADAITDKNKCIKRWNTKMSRKDIESLLYFAVEYGALECVKVLIKHNEDWCFKLHRALLAWEIRPWNDNLRNCEIDILNLIHDKIDESEIRLLKDEYSKCGDNPSHNRIPEIIEYLEKAKERAKRRNKKCL